MNLLVVIAVCTGLFVLAYRLYGGLLGRLFKLDADAPTPAVAMRDDVDYAPLEPRSLLSQHFSAIAAAGPIVGPILAGVWFGWAPALIWIVLGSIFIGGVHDLGALLASIRHRARSIAEVVREYTSRRAYLLFLIFIWLALVYVIVAFTDITASSFVGRFTLENGETVRGGGIAASSLLYLLLPVVMGLLLRFTRLSITLATVIFLPLVGMSIWAGQHIPLDLRQILGLSSDAQAQSVWNVLLLAYCFIASIAPMWLLLQPRGHLGGYFLFVALVGGMAGLVIGGHPIEYPAFIGWSDRTGQPLFPVLFITIACGACSGFHAMVASGTTCKQLRRETDALPVAYGAMLMEGLVAVLSLGCVMMLSAQSPLVSGERPLSPNFIYANGVGTFLGHLGIPSAFAVSFALMAFTTFVYDTLDVCTRLGRYIVQELTGWSTRVGGAFAAAVTVGLPLWFLMGAKATPDGKLQPIWKTFWGVFGASNQLLAALTLMGVTVWLWRTRRARWVWPVTGLPAAMMYVISMTELARLLRKSFSTGLTNDPVAWVALVLAGLALLMLFETVRTGRKAATLVPA